MDRKLSKGEILLRQIIFNNKKAATNGVFLNDLLEEVYRGYPVKHILRLLKSKNIDVNRAGVWILSELGSSMCCVFDKVKHLIESADYTIKFLSMKFILNCALEKDAEFIYLLSKLVDDPEVGIRSQALDTLTQLEQRQVMACMKWMDKNNINNSLSQGYRLFLKSKREKYSIEQFRMYFKSEDIILRKLTFVAAIRLGIVTDELREEASSLNEKDIDLLIDI